MCAACRMELILPRTFPGGIEIESLDRVQAAGFGTERGVQVDGRVVEAEDMQRERGPSQLAGFGVCSEHCCPGKALPAEGMFDVEIEDEASPLDAAGLGSDPGLPTSWPRSRLRIRKRCWPGVRMPSGRNRSYVSLGRCGNSACLQNVTRTLSAALRGRSACRKLA